MSQNYYFILLILLFCKMGYSQDIIEEYNPNGKLSIHKTNGHFQLINIAGEAILSELDSVYQHKNGSFLVMKKGVWGMTSIYGEVIIPIAFDKIELKYNLYWEVVTKDNKKGVYPSYRGPFLPAEYDDIQIVRELDKGFIVKKSGKYGVYNSKGEIVVPLIYDNILDYGRALVLKTKTKSEYLIGNKIISDSIVLKKTFDLPDHHPSQTGRYFVLYKEGKHGVLDYEGNTVIDPKYEDLVYQQINTGNKIESYILVKQNELWGMIDLSENQILPFKYQKIEFINSDFAIVKFKDYMYFYNFRTRKLIDEYNFESFHMHGYEFSRLKKEGKETLVNNKTGKLVFPFIYESVFMKGQHIEVKQNSKYGLVDFDNNIIIPIQYESIMLFCNKVIVEKEGKHGILSLDNEILIPFENINILTWGDKTIEIWQNSSSDTKTYDCDLNCIKNCN